MWQIEKTESFWYNSSRNGKTWMEITFWFNPETMERKETRRSHSCYDGQEWENPDWTKPIEKYSRHLDYDY